MLCSTPTQGRNCHLYRRCTWEWNRRMKNKAIVSFCVVALTSSCSGMGGFPSLTRADVQNAINQSTQSSLVLPMGTHKGCVTVPGGVIQRAMVGFRFTGEPCSFEIGSSNNVSVSFLGNTNIQVFSTGPARYPEDVYVAELENDQLLVMQHNTHGNFVTATLTTYDKNNNAIYGGQGIRSYIKQCYPIDRSCN